MRQQFHNNNNFRPRQRQRSRTPQVNGELLRAMRDLQLDKKVIEEKIEEVAFVPVHTFNDFSLSDQLKRNIISKKYTSPTPIQDQAIPSIIEGRDLIGIANTGTGKTAAFLLPLIEKVSKSRDQKVLIVAPTRELALQIDEELYAFTKGLNIYAALCIGGMNMTRQRIQLRKNPQFVIGTPGRIKDFIQSKVLSLEKFNNVVLDEADRMVDIGFVDDIKYFISLLPRERQSLFFSATISSKVKDILQAFVQNPVTVSVKKQDTATNVEQEVIKVVSREKKIEQLHDLLIKKEFEKVLIFGRTKWGIQKLADELIDRGFKAGAIHGNKRQSQRHMILEKFKHNEIKILLATDVASRGLDIRDVSHVINYDMPNSYEDYIHRIGRTGRANSKGIALTFID